MKWNVGAKNGMWKGGRVVEPRGYVLVRVGKAHPLADVRGYAYEHRLRAWERGDLVGGKDVHHGDEDPGNNADENLAALTRHEHRARHRTSGKHLQNPGESNTLVVCRCGCGTEFPKFDRAGRPRVYVSGHNAHPSRTKDGVLVALSDGPLHRSDLAVAVGCSLGAVATALSKLRSDGLVQPVGAGLWEKTHG